MSLQFSNSSFNIVRVGDNILYGLLPQHLQWGSNFCPLIAASAVWVSLPIVVEATFEKNTFEIIALVEVYIRSCACMLLERGCGIRGNSMTS